MSLITTSENKNKKVVDITVQIPYNEIKKGGEKMKNSRIELRVSQEEKEKIDKEAEKENKASDDTKDHHYNTETKCFVTVSEFINKCQGKCTDYSRTNR